MSENEGKKEDKTVFIEIETSENNYWAWAKKQMTKSSIF